MAHSRQICLLSFRLSLGEWRLGLIRSLTAHRKAHFGPNQATGTQHERRFYSRETGASGAAAVGSPQKVSPQILSTLERYHEIKSSLLRTGLSRTERNAKIFERICGPPSAAEQQIAVELEKPAVSPRSVLLRCIANEEATVRIVYLCILARRNQIESLPRRRRPDLRSEIFSEQFGTHALHHMLRDINLWLVFADAGLETIMPLCYLVIMEGNESALRRWLGINVPQLHGWENEHNWRGKIFRGLVDAHAYLDTTLCADPVLKCLLEVTATLGTRDSGVKGEPLGRDLPVLDCAAALNITEKNLCDPKHPRGWHNTDPGLYNEFTALIARRQDPLSLARLSLYHPKAPSEQQALALARDYVTAGTGGSKIAYTFRNTLQVRALRSTRQFFDRAAEVAENNGNNADADWLRREVLKQLDRDIRAGSYQSRSADQSNAGTASPSRKVPLPQFR